MLLWNWRVWVLGLLLAGPPAVYIALGAAWLAQRGWLLIGFLCWTVAATAFGFLSVRWTRARREASIAPLDWTTPETFAPRDQEAWQVVQNEAELAETASVAELVSLELYQETGVRLAARLSQTYDPGAETPIENVPIADLLTAIELAADDLNGMLREVPGGDIATFAHGKAAVQAASFVARANEYYNYLLPFFQPVQGMLRLGSTKLMTQPAWKNMQQNLLRWFYRAYVQRLGIHLIEMYSGRLSVGSREYKRLTGRLESAAAAAPGRASTDPRTTIAISGARGAGKSTLTEALEGLRSIDLEELHALLRRHRQDPELAEVLSRVSLIETESYGTRGDKDPFLDRMARRGAVDGATHADMLILVVDSRRTDFRSDGRFAKDWVDWYGQRPGLARPPALVVLTNTDRLMESESAGETGATDTAAALRRGRIAALQEVLPQGFASKIITVGLGSIEAGALEEALVPPLASLVSQCARGALIRHFHEHASRSKAGRFFKQVGRHGHRAWSYAGGEIRKRWKGRKQDEPEPVESNP